MTSADVTSADQHVQAFTARLTALREDRTRARQRMAEATGTARSQDGAVTVTASAAGALLDVEFAATAVPGPALATSIRQAVSAAREQALHSAADAVAGIVGPDSRAVGVLRRQADTLHRDTPADDESGDESGDEGWSRRGH